MAKYRIIKDRDGDYLIERKVFLVWTLIAFRADYQKAVQVVDQEQAKDAEGLPKIVLER